MSLTLDRDGQYSALDLDCYYSWVIYIYINHVYFPLISFPCVNFSVFFYITGIVVLSEFGFSKRNPYVSMLVLLSMLVLFFILSVIVLEVKYSKRKWDKLKKSYWQAIRQSISKYLFSRLFIIIFNSKKNNVYFCIFGYLFVTSSYIKRGFLILTICKVI